MNFVKKLFFMATVVTMFSTSAANLKADECCYVDNSQCCVDPCGCGYDQGCCASSLAPALALGAIAVVAIIAIAVQDPGGHHHHSHSH